MKPIIITSDTLPVLTACDFCMANESFYHIDRTPNFHILIYVVSGCIYVTEEETDYEVHEGELLILQSGVRHYGLKPISKGTSWYYVHFYLDPTSERLPYIYGSPLPSFRDAFRFQMELPKYRIGLEQSKTAEMIADLADSLHSGNAMTNLTNTPTDYHANDAMAFWNANLRLFSILTELAVGSLPPAPKQSLSDRIAEYLSDHVRESFSAAALEKQFFLSYKHMASVFKKEKQMTLHQYHTRLRMSEACHLLRTTMKSVGEISEDLGYHDMLYFSRCFHQTIGMSPTEYRREQVANY